MEDRIIDTVLGTFIIENFGDDYDIATDITDGMHFYRIEKDLSEQEIKELFKKMSDFLEGCVENLKK